MVPYAGGQLAAWLRVRCPDVIAGAISSSPTLLGAPGLGLVSQPVLLSCQTCMTAKCTAGCFCWGLLVLLNPTTQTHDMLMLMYVTCPHLFDASPELRLRLPDELAVACCTTDMPMLHNHALTSDAMSAAVLQHVCPSSSRPLLMHVSSFVGS